MYQIKLYDYVPKPDPANTFGRIVAAHYYPSWTRGENTLNHEFLDDFPYPERTPLIGFYEDHNPEVIDWEIKYMLEHGVNCWIYCWYRKRSNIGKPVTVADLRLSRGLHEGFFRARYGNMMKFAIMFETQPRWAAADRDDLLNNVLPFWIKEYFSRDNYLKIDNKPVVFLYDTAHQLRDCLGDNEGMKKAFDDCREAVKAVGYDGLMFAEQICSDVKEPFADAREKGVDFMFLYSNGSYGSGLNQIAGETVYRNQLSRNYQLLGQDPYCFVPTISPFRDSEPRINGMQWNTSRPNYWYIDFQQYRKLLRAAKAMCDAAPVDSIAHKLMMVDNANEWDEGHYLLPSYRFGFKHLQCIREELTDHENLPDYRTPESLGFAPYDEAWGGRSIDLSQYNNRKLDDGEFTQYRYFSGNAE